MIKQQQTFDTYIASLPLEQQAKMKESIAYIRQQVPPKTLEKIAYGMPSWHHNTYLIHVGAFKKHWGIYPGPSAIEACQQWCKNFKTSKGSIQIPWTEPLPKTLIKALIQFNFSAST